MLCTAHDDVKLAITLSLISNCCITLLFAACSDLLAFKSTVAGDTTAASINTDPAVTAHGLASGSYTFYKDSAEGIGAAVIAVTEPVGSIQACLNLCDADPRCAAAVMTGVAAIGDVPTACSLVRGDTTVGVFKRSVTKTVLSRLSLATVLANGA